MEQEKKEKRYAELNKGKLREITKERYEKIKTVYPVIIFSNGEIAGYIEMLEKAGYKFKVQEKLLHPIGWIDNAIKISVVDVEDQNKICAEKIIDDLENGGLIG